MISLEQLQQIMPYAHARAAEFLDSLNQAMDEFDINTPDRQAAFLGQIAHESGQLRYTEEIASGAAYEGRQDLGNTEPGDGVRFKGRGLLQLTGRYGYAKCGDALGIDLIGSPELLTVPENACRSAAWWWKAHGCNELADLGDYRKITLRINGGLTHYDDRLAYWNAAKDALA